MTRLIQLTCSDPNTNWKSVVFCDACLRAHHKHLLKDWFIQSRPVRIGSCASFAHKKLGGES